MVSKFMRARQLKNSRDLTLVIMFAVLSFVFMALIGQVPRLITGVRGIGYAFTIIYTIANTVVYLMYEGRRWRIFAQGTLYGLLSLSLVQYNQIPTALATIVTSFLIDLIFNSYYRFFQSKKKLVWWSILGQVCFWTMHPFWILLFSSSLFFPLEVVLTGWFFPIMSVMLPLMIVEAVAGGFIGYKIYRRVENLA